MNEIIYPNETTYFIARNGIITYGIVESHQCMATGLPNLEQFLDKDAWIHRLYELGISEAELIDAGFIINENIAP